ncbi:MAG TPA: hypothetical protein VMT58_09040 [Candidatus Binataceae bacterium]|nr:hypothetical protein [Candidatus Binataceae bacterium]
MKINWDEMQAAFYDLLEHVTIVSKDEGRTRLVMYDAQRYAFDEIFDGFRHDQHWFVIGKGRQLGVTTGCLLFDVFYAGAMPNIQSGVVFDSAGNVNKFRKILGDMLESLPPSHAIPIRKGGNNREGIVFENGNMLDYLVAGVKRGSGTLGRSRALNYCHASECAYYGDPDAVEAFKDVLSDTFPYRAYFWESTGNGYNFFHSLWEDAVADTIAKRAIFVTWWRKRTYSYKKGTALFRRYGWPDLDRDEREATAEVKRLYGYQIGIEQWAWYRHRSDPRAQANDDSDEISDSDRREVITQEHPHYPEQMFRGTGSPFIPVQAISSALAKAERALFKAYAYYLGEDVTATRIEPTKFINRAQLRVFQEPDPAGIYVVSGDPAFGSSDEGDRFCAQVVRCYADRLEQVAVFTDANIQPYQFAWVLIHLCGWYENCRYILELNGSGEAVMTEMRNLKTMLETGRLAPRRRDADDPTPEELEAEQSWRNMLRQVRQYLYHRADSITAGSFNIQWKTTFENKFTIMTQMSDRFMLDQLIVNDVRTLQEMRTLRKDGRSIQAELGHHDDRAVALALAVRAYIDAERRTLVADNRTYEVERRRAEEFGSEDRMETRFMAMIMRNAFQQKSRDRRDRQRFQRRQRWNW